MPTYWSDPDQFECVVQQNLAAYYDQGVNRRRLFSLLRTHLKACLPQREAIPNLYLPTYGLDLASIVVFDAVRPLLADLLYSVVASCS